MNVFKNEINGKLFFIQNLKQFENETPKLVWQIELKM